MSEVLVEFIGAYELRKALFLMRFPIGKPRAQELRSREFVVYRTMDGNVFYYQDDPTLPPPISGYRFENPGEAAIWFNQESKWARAEIEVA